jgi:hypothetical protein
MELNAEIGTMDFEAKLASFVTGFQAIFDAALVSQNYFPVVSAQPGKRFIKIVMAEIRYETKDTIASRVIGFVEKETGKVYKAASWKAPALNFPRGNIFDDKNGLGRASWSGGIS